MRDVWEFLRAILKKHTELLTGSLIAVYLSVQPYTSFLPSPPRKVFWGIVAFAGAIASFRAWREERVSRIKAEALLAQHNSVPEDPRVAITVRWPDDDPNNGPMQIVARNRGKQLLHSFQIKSVPLGFHSITFNEVPELQSNIESLVPYRITGAGDQAIDFLDILMMHKTGEISTTSYSLKAEVQMQNGQRRNLRFELIYAPLHNPRMNHSAGEFESMIVVEQT